MPVISMHLTAILIFNGYYLRWIRVFNSEHKPHIELTRLDCLLSLIMTLSEHLDLHCPEEEGSEVREG